tara:strand:- start:590 stop:934 length:345 start_codon:yes stop_codon:yes gene_type:complete
MGQPIQSNNQNMGLQNLAWLGENGQVHTVNQNNQLGGRPMLGASMPPNVGLQNLAYIGENGQLHTKKNGMLGASSPMLINLGFLSDMKHKVADSGFVNTDGLDALHGKVGGLKE